MGVEIRKVDATPLVGDLDAIGVKFGSDKSSLIHNYLHAFERKFGHLRHESVTILEFCASVDTSVRLWVEYFSRATIVAVFPLIPASAAEGLPSDRVIILEGRQNEDAIIKKILDTYQPTIVIDDSEHIWSSQLDCLLGIYPALQEGALYIIEDTQTLRLPGGPSQGTFGEATVQNPLFIAAQSLAVDGPVPVTDENFEILSIAKVVREWTAELSFSKGFVCLRRGGSVASKVLPVEAARTLADRFVEVDSGGEYPRIQAEIHNCPAWLEDRFRKAVAAPTETHVPPGGVAFFKDATVHGRGLVITASGKIVDESRINAQHNKVLANFVKTKAGGEYVESRPDKNIIARPDAPTVLLKQMWDSNYGHWVVESLPRVGLLQGVVDISSCNFLVQIESNALNTVYQDSLSYFGIEPEQVSFTSYATAAVENLIYPLPLTRQPWVKAPFTMRLLENFPAHANALAAQPAAPPKKIYVTRSASYQRHITNEPEILELVRGYGFEIVVPEKLSFWEQVRMFSQADCVVGILGAGLTNLVFAPRGIMCVALTSEYMGDDFFYDIICHKGGRYISLHGKATDPSKGMNSDFEIDPMLVRKFIEQSG